MWIPGPHTRDPGLGAQESAFLELAASEAAGLQRPA